MTRDNSIRVLVTGATGFIGGRLCEVMALTRGFIPRPMVHSTGSASRIARFDLDFVVGDLCNRDDADRAVEGCDAIVHLARGSRAVMYRGLANVLRAAVKHKVSRFVHLSSVAVYGNNPPPASVSEDAPAKRTELEYGNEKLAQERTILDYSRRHGLPVVILRPPNVYGPYAPFTAGVLDRLRRGRLPIVNGGTNPCNLVGVDNLVEAILLSVWKPEAVGETFFVTDPDVITWKRCLTDHAALIGGSVPEVGFQDLVPVARRRMIRESILAVPRVLVSSEFRSALRRIPMFAQTEERIYEAFETLSTDTKQRIRLAINGPEVPKRADKEACRLDDPLISAQGRQVAHSCQKAQSLLGYRGYVPYEEGMELTKRWIGSSGTELTGS